MGAVVTAVILQTVVCAKWAPLAPAAPQSGVPVRPGMGPASETVDGAAEGAAKGAAGPRVRPKAAEEAIRGGPQRAL